MKNIISKTYIPLIDSSSDSNIYINITNSSFENI